MWGHQEGSGRLVPAYNLSQILQQGCTGKRHSYSLPLSTHSQEILKKSLVNPQVKSFLLFVVLSHVQLFASPWTTACQAPLSMGFPRQEYWRGLPFPFPGGLPVPGMEPMSPALANRFFTTEPLWKPKHLLDVAKIESCAQTKYA